MRKSYGMKALKMRNPVSPTHQVASRVLNIAICLWVCIQIMERPDAQVAHKSDIDLLP